MASGITNYDWVLTVKEKPWHGIGTTIETAPTSKEAIKLSKLDWNVKQYQLKANGKAVEGYYANIRQDTNEVLGVVKSRYKIVQNVQAFDFVDDVIRDDNIEATYETAGSIFGGKRVFLVARLPEQILVDDTVQPYMFFTNSHDGTSALTVGLTNVRVVCNNTLQLALKQAPRIWRCKHTVNIDGKVEAVKRSIINGEKYLTNIKELADEMVNKKIKAEKFLKTLFEKSQMSDKATEKTIERIFTIYREKDDLQNYKGTAWGMYNAVADFVSNTKPLRETKGYKDVKLEGFFDGYEILQTTQNLLMVA